MTICNDCGRTFEPTYMKNGRPHAMCSRCRESRRKQRAKERQRRGNPAEAAEYLRGLRRRYRQEAFDAYGGKCACCGVSEYEFLTIDHPNGGGRKERAAVTGKSGGSSFARYLARQGYPEGYRILCHNCNSAYGYFGHCPHNKLVSNAN